MALWVSIRRPPTRRAPVRRWLVAAPVVAVVLTAGCGTADTGVPASQAVPAGNGPSISGSQPGEPQVGAASTGAPRSNRVLVPVQARSGISATITALGTVLSSDGFTLYRYAKDRSAPPESTCTGGCAATWRPVPATGPLGGTGMDSALLGTVIRPDGTSQLTVDGWPAYRFVRDTAPGEVEGQGGAWTAIGLDGKPVA